MQQIIPMVLLEIMVFDSSKVIHAYIVINNCIYEEFAEITNQVDNIYELVAEIANIATDLEIANLIELDLNTTELLCYIAKEKEHLYPTFAKQLSKYYSWPSLIRLYLTHSKTKLYLIHLLNFISEYNIDWYLILIEAIKLDDIKAKKIILDRYQYYYNTKLNVSDPRLKLLLTRSKLTSTF